VPLPEDTQRKAEAFDAVDVIRVKRDKGTLSPEQIDWVIDAYTRGVIAEEQMAALNMAILLNGMDRETVAQRTGDLLDLLDLREAGGTLVVDYSAGMTKKVALACALVHAPRLLVLDEPFESVDPVSAANIRDILAGYVRGGGTVIVSSHSMDLVQRMCDHVAVVAAGRVLAAGTTDEVRGGSTLEDRFVELVGGRQHNEGPSWLHTS